MRKIILTAAAIVGLAGPAFADMTLPVGDYPQAGAAGWAGREASPPAFDATVEPSTHFFTGRSAYGHERSQR